MKKSKKEYSGAFLWLAAFSFLIPIYVGAQAFKAIPQPPRYPEIHPDISGVDHNLWDYLLRTYIANGLVDYEGLKRDFLFKTYLKQLAGAHPENLKTESAKLACYCNAYNAFVIHGVIIHKIKGSVLDLKQNGETDFFDIKEHILAGKTISLNTLEHKRIREEFHDPRVHMALVCAAKSCPRIRPEAYTADRLNEQLEDQANSFANNPEYVKYVPEENKLYLSSILNWYKDDFGGNYGVISFLLPRVKDPATKTGLERALAGQVELVYFKYDWGLNSQDSEASSAGNSASFGSGSIPNE